MANPIEIIEGLRDVQDGLGEFIRNGPSTGLPGYIRDKYRERCNQFANLPAWARLLGNGTAGTMDRMCTPYWDDNNWDGPEVAPPPFTGGQCDFLYLFDIAGRTSAGISGGTTCSGNVPYSTVGSAWGPLSNFRLGGASDCSGGDGPSQEVLVTCHGAGGGARSPTPVTVAVTSPVFTFSISNVRPQSGVPDSCGNLPPEIGPGPNPPPDPGPIGGPVPTTDPRNPTGPPLIPLPPYEDPVYGPIPIEGPQGPPGPPAPPSGPPPGDIGDPGTPGDTGSGGEAEGEAPDGQVLVGLKVDVLESPPKARQFAPGVFRGAGYIYMGVTGNLDQDYGGSMLKSGQFFFAEKENLTSWLVSANTGYNFRVTPYYREAQE